MREQLRRRLAQSATAGPEQRRGHLAAARGLAEDYAIAWRDSVLIRMVDRFESLPARDRVTQVLADSLRRAGFQAFPRAGPAAAMRLWRESRIRSASIGDSSGLAATLGNLGAGFLALDELDSARIHLARSRALARQIRDWRTLGNVLGTLGALEKAASNDAAARIAYTDALSIRGRSGDDRGAAADKNNLGLLAESAGDTATARRFFEAALRRNRRAGRAGAAGVNLANLANLAIADGRYADAATLYRDALALHRRAGELVDAGLDLHDIGALELRQGKYRAAVDALAEAVSILDETGPPAEAAAVSADLASAYAAMGDVGNAIRVLDRAEIASRAAAPGTLALLTLVRADIAVDIGNPDAARTAYARAESLYLSEGDVPGATEAQQGLGLLQLRRGNYRDAARTLAAASESQRAAGEHRGSALTDLILGRAMLEQGDTTGAAATIRRARLALHRIGDPVGEAAAFAASGELAERHGRTRDAEAMYRSGLRRLTGLTAPTVDMQLRWGLGRTLRTRGALAAAARELQLAIDAVEHTAMRVTTAELRKSMLSGTGQIYAELALVEHARGRDAIAFETSERLRSRQMRELMAHGAIPSPPNVDGRFAERERHLRGRIDELQGGGPGASSRSALMRDIPEASNGATGRESLAEAQTAYGTLLGELARTAPDYATLLRPPTASHRAVAAHLRADEALLEYLVSDSMTLLFVITRDSLRAFPIPIGRRGLAAAIDFARAAITRRPATLSPEPWALPLRRLHRLLVQPAEASGMLRGVRTLIIAPHAELNFLPFAALMPASGARYLVETYDVGYVPSAAIWMQLGARARPSSNGRTLIVAPFPSTLPGSRDEAAGIRQVYGRDATLLIGPEATERAFTNVVSGYSTVHLATYGVLNRQNPLFSHVAFAPDAGGAGRLEVQEVFGLALRARLLVLSACETGLGSGSTSDVPPGDDWVGLVRAFLFAGADNVMATLWPIEDRSTSLIIPRVHGSLVRGGSVARSLALAQRSALRDPATAAPRHWAALVLVGAVR